MAQARAVAKFWIATSNQIERVLSHEKLMQSAEPTKDVRVVHRLVSDLYCRYVGLCRNLDRCFDQTLQVQKRKVIQGLLEAANARMLELQSKLQEIELSEFVYIDGALQELHLIPDDVQAMKPCYFPAKRPAELQSLVDSSKLERFEYDEQEEEDGDCVSLQGDQETEDTPALSETPSRPVIVHDRKKERLRAALALITAHEKARQARVRQTNFRLHPDRYFPKPIDEEIEDIQYEYFFRPGQQMLYPVKRTVYNWDFQMKKKNVVDFAYYAPPGYQSKPPPAITKPRRSTVRYRKPVKQEEIAKPTEEIERMAEDALKIKRLNHAAVRIQRCWRRYRTLKEQKRLRYEKSKFLGLFDDYECKAGSTNTVEKARTERRDMKQEFDRKFLEAVADEKARILRTRGPALLEDIGDFVRTWFRQWYDEAHAFDVLPEPFQGGTVLVVRGETLTPTEYLEKERLKQLDKLKSPEQKKKEADAAKAAKEQELTKKREEKERLKDQAREQRAREKKEGKTYDFSAPEFVSNAYVTLEETIRRYRKDWAFIKEIEGAPADLPIMEWITLEKFAEVHQEMHGEVHELLKSERELLQIALCKDERKKYKPPKLKKPPRAKGKGKGKRKEPIDLTAEQTPASMFEELVQRNVIKSYRKRTFEEFVGDFNYCAFERRNRLEQNPPPGMGEVRTILRSYLFGMGPLSVPKPKSICLLGPSGYGKTLLLEAICNETGSLLFDLGVETCSSVPSTGIPAFFQLVLAVARIFQPSVIAIEEVHRAFYKKAPPQERACDPDKIGKHLFKLLVKQLRPEDKVLLVATSNQPWLAKVGPLKKCFDKFLLLPRPDYGYTVLLWQHALRRIPSVPRDMDLSVLATVTRGYSAGQILRCTREVLGIRRRMQFGRRPLQVEELLHYLLEQAGQYPIVEKEYDKYLKWHRKVDKLAKMRAKLTRERQLLAEQSKAKGAGK